jgi:LacI family transcriptional regulator
LIAELANVSIGTVDRVLHDRPGVAKKTKEKVLKVIEQLNYQPNILARRLVSKKKYVFAVLMPIPTEDNPYWEIHEKGIKKAEIEISPFGINIERLSYSQDDRDSFLVQVDKIIKGNYDGIMTIPFHIPETLTLVQHCKENDIPCVFFDTKIHDPSILTFIGQDAFKSGYFGGKLVSYLLSENESVLIANINTTVDTDNHLKRGDGFKAFIHENKLQKVRVFENKFDSSNIDEFENEVLASLKNNPDIKAIFVTNSRAFKIAQILEKHALVDLKLIGYDLIRPNVEFLEKGYIDFLISQEPVSQGYSGVMALYKHLVLKQEIEKEILMPIDVILKENLEFYIN